MQNSSGKKSTRRAFLQQAGALATATTLAATATPRVHAGEKNEIKLALIGCGGRGTGAAMNALKVKNGPTKLVAMADVFEDRLKPRQKMLSDRFGDKVDVPDERLFLGFDAYKKAMECLDAGDVAIFATPPAFRWVHFEEAIKRNLNVFMEKPVTVDGPTTRRMLELDKKAKEKNLKVGVGLMVRHCRGRRELYDRIRDGEIGGIRALRAYRMGGWPGKKPNNGKLPELAYQIRNFHGFLWASGGCYSDFYIHQIDECSWMKDAWPVEAQANGGRHYREGTVDQNFDNYSVEYLYPDGTKLYYYGRNIPGCVSNFSSIAHGTTGSAIISAAGHYPGKVATFKGQDLDPEKRIWAFPQPEPNPYDLEWEDLIAAIREDKPFNEVERGSIASLVSCMGRMAAHTGQIITFDQMMECPHEFAPGVDQFVDMDSTAPLKPDDEGRYPCPKPGIKKDREY